MMKRTLYAITTLAIIWASAMAAAQDEMAVDNADSFDPESFHKSKADELKFYDSASGKFLTRGNAQDGSVDEFDATEYPAKADKRHEIRTRYGVDHSNSTIISAHSAIDVMHRKMAQQCPRGWQKQREWSVAVGGDYDLYFEFQCL